MKETVPVYRARLAPGHQPISFREIADECDGFDADVDQVNEQRKAFWASVREILPARDVKALKAAIKARRKRKADKDGEEAYEARVAEILEEIEAGTPLAEYSSRVPTRAAREPRADFEWQPPRPASISEIRQAFRDGKPISMDFAFEGAEVYFAHFPDLGRLKIGISNDAVARVADISANVGAAAVLVATMPGNRKAEMAAHRAFAAWKLEGEWFNACPECLEHIAAYTHARRARDFNKGRTWLNEPDLPPHDADGVLIEEQFPARQSASGGMTGLPEESGALGQSLAPTDGGSHVAGSPSPLSDSFLEIKTDFIERLGPSGADTGSDVRTVAQVSEPASAPPSPEVVPAAGSDLASLGAPAAGSFPDLPEFLDRRSKAA